MPGMNTFRSPRGAGDEAGASAMWSALGVVEGREGSTARGLNSWVEALTDHTTVTSETERIVGPEATSRRRG